MTSAASRGATAAGLLPALALAACTGAAPAPAEPVVIGGQTMGTYYSVSLNPEDARDLDLDELEASLDAVLQRVNDQMSTYLPDSELSRFNSGDARGWFPVSGETAAVSLRALEIGEMSGGAFDPTTGSLVNLWGFGPEGRPDRVPSETEIEAARERVGLARFEVRSEPPALRKTRPDIYVDLSGIAKGHGVDEMARLLESRGLTRYLADIGGEMRAAGEKAPGKRWSVAVERPEDTRRSIHKVLEITDIAIATSGDYRNYFEEDGRRYSHTIDPRTGRPIEHRLASVTVLARDCTSADGLATALMVLGPDEGYTLAVEHGIAALMLVRAGESFQEKATPAFKAFMKETGS